MVLFSVDARQFFLSKQSIPALHLAKSHIQYIQSDSLAGGPKLLSIKTNVIYIERETILASIMSRSCLASFPVCVYKFLNYYFGASSERITLYKRCWQEAKAAGGEADQSSASSV